MLPSGAGGIPLILSKLLQCNIENLRIFGKMFPPLFSLFAHVQILWLRLAALGLGVLVTLR